MNYLVLIPDGMADEKNEALNWRTPMEAASIPTMDRLARTALVGTVSNVPVGMVPESDTANMAILSFDPKLYSKGRSPLEALSMGLAMREDETAFRTNLVTLSEEDGPYEGRTMLDHSADEISTEEADALIRTIEEHFGCEDRHFYTGISYRHCLLWRHREDNYPFVRPHDILGQCIGEHLPHGEAGAEYLALMKESYDLLNRHPVNEARRKRGLRPANSIWFWSPGKKPQLPSFSEKWGLRGAVISAVDLIKGIGLCAGMRSIDVEGATGNVHTNYKGKAEAAIHAFQEGYEYVYVHVEGPDECGHRAEVDNKVLAIERIDREILSPVHDYLEASGKPYRIMVLPDHPTPLHLRTHTSSPVPFLIYDPQAPKKGVEHFDEASAATTGVYIANGWQLNEYLIQDRKGDSCHE